MVIPEGVEMIFDDCFLECGDLEYVSLPSTINYIGEHAFALCRKLMKIEMHEGIEHIDPYAFKSIGSIEEIVIPESVRSIGEYAF